MTTLVEWSLFWLVRLWRLLLAHGAVMEKSTAVLSVEFKVQAQKTIALALSLCEKRLVEYKQKEGPPPELKALAAAALSLETAIAAFVAADGLCE